MKKIAIICLLTLVSWTWFSKSLTFNNRITLIHSKVVDLTDIFVLHGIKEFNEVYFNPSKFQDSVVNYLKLPRSEGDKLISVCSMTNLPVDRYVDFINSCYSCYNQKKINANLFERCIFNEFDSRHKFISQYKNPLVQHMLKNLLSSKTLLKGFKSGIKDFKSGKIYNDLKKAGQL